jgi:hypothetical protein
MLDKILRENPDSITSEIRLDVKERQRKLEISNKQRKRKRLLQSLYTPTYSAASDSEEPEPRGRGSKIQLKDLQEKLSQVDNSFLAYFPCRWCLLPLSSKEHLEKHLWQRHQARIEDSESENNLSRHPTVMLPRIGGSV